MCMERVNTLVYRLQSKVPSWLTKVAPAHALVEAVGTHTQDANQISRKWTHHITTLLFFGFGLWSLWDGFTEEGEAEELAEVGAKLAFSIVYFRYDGATRARHRTIRMF
ncbi:uncharacterized protein LOC122296564 isoform X2 [Carya illinoinensis]|uniref:uncharacterized protein LOC122296564 isoform X2 n=1 Tax=Carya illinoinensis TaxID=32201 RepID=UPI001C71CAEE|nr:uncharacterized protein LOC122296564 isoform X2 [Carya illinoinensis]